MYQIRNKKRLLTLPHCINVTGWPVVFGKK